MPCCNKTAAMERAGNGAGPTDAPDLYRAYLEWDQGRRRFHDQKAAGEVRPDGFSAGDLNRIRQSVTPGVPLGTDDWSRATAARMGLEASLRPRGRPRKNT
jgi:hypothetical protein